MVKRILVTGSSRGLGFSTTKKLLEHDYEVVGISRGINDNVKILLNTFKGKYYHLKYDLSDVGNLEIFFKKEVKRFSPFYGFVGNAAIAYDDLLTNANLNRLNMMFNVNVIANILISKFIVREMLLHEISGSLVFVSSVSSTVGFKGLSMYGATKGAIESFVKGAAREWGRYRIRFNAVAPGFMETDMTSGLENTIKERIYKRTSIKGPVDINSVVETVLFLLSDKASSITGTVIRVDNGSL